MLRFIEWGVPYAVYAQPPLVSRAESSEGGLVAGRAHPDFSNHLVKLPLRRWYTVAKGRGRTDDLPILRSRDNSSWNTVHVRDLHHRVDLNTDERRRT
jgi:hypothetical protein